MSSLFRCDMYMCVTVEGMNLFCVCMCVCEGELLCVLPIVIAIVSHGYIE